MAKSVTNSVTSDNSKSDLRGEHFDVIIALVVGGMTVKGACESNPAFPSSHAFLAYVRRSEDRRNRLAAATFAEREGGPNATGRKPARSTGRYWEADFDAALVFIERSAGSNIKKALKAPLPT